MIQVILYLILIVVCIVLYFFMSTDLYFRLLRVQLASGHIGTIVKENDRIQYQILFIDEKGQQRIAVSPKYNATDKYQEGDIIPIKYAQLNLFNKICINSVRIDDPNLMRMEKYTICLALAGVLIFFMGVRILTQFIL